MKRFNKNFSIKDINLLKSQLQHWCQEQDIFYWLDSNNHIDPYSSYDAILAVEENCSIKLDTTTNAFNLLNDFQKLHNDFLFGFLTYDLKNDIENLTSNNCDRLNFPALYFFQPKKLIFIKNNIVTFSYINEFKTEIENDFQSISNQLINFKTSENSIKENEIKQRISKNIYLKKCNQLLKRIQHGDIYEINFCMEFFLEQRKINPHKIFTKLNSISSAPFSCFIRHHNLYLCSASPERYIKKIGQKVISQPIKGTAKRGISEEQDIVLKNELKKNLKERSENIMIVDLVRNDLSKTAIKGSVNVEELCGLYTFKQVHQLISTVSSEISSEIEPVTILKNTFPMGSMTGAPKISAMNIIDEVEETKRGLYSGSVGYFTPDGDFDFNVVIRSIIHNSDTQYTSFSVGSAITALSNPEQEYEECLLKGKAMKQVLIDA
ncbi:MAG: anthranilate synthase component I family protein [Flavobacteriaceae bacterium]|nr:anthranilate synthase component I family protein [Flavobacteriaceae bacterium]